MNVSVTAIALHNREQIEAILDEAREIADARPPGVAEWETYFAAAVSLLSARHVIESHTAPVSLPSLGQFPRVS